MNRIAAELDSITKGLKECLTVEFKKVAPDKADFVNAICSDIVDMADRIRRNEDISLGINRESDGDMTRVKVNIGDHEEMDAIKQGIAEMIAKKSKKRGLEVETK